MRSPGAVDGPADGCAVKACLCLITAIARRFGSSPAVTLHANESARAVLQVPCPGSAALRQSRRFAARVSRDAIGSTQPTFRLAGKAVSRICPTSIQWPFSSARGRR
jgi:hypothetical protein